MDSRNNNRLLDMRMIASYDENMKLTLQLQILPSEHQKSELLRTMETFNAAASFAANVGFNASIYGQVSLHRLTYASIREKFKLSSQMAIRAIAKAVECFQQDNTVCPIFRPHGAITYDQRILSFKGLTEVSLWTMAGRMRLSYICGAYQKALQGRIKGQADLVYRDGKFYLHCTIDLPEAPPIQIQDAIGIDLGICNLATDSTGETFSGDDVEKIRQHYAMRRAGLNRNGSKSARRRLSKIRQREGNYRRNENHRISKRLVEKAKATASVIVFEDLKHIRERVLVNGRQRAKNSGWAFFQLQSFTAYKAKLAGVHVAFIDPRNTSRTCSRCGHCEKANRINQADFCCKQCRFSCNADWNAAQNIRLKWVRQPSSGVGLSAHSISD